MKHYRRFSYTRREQTSPGRKRGRLPVPGCTKLKNRTSLADILNGTPLQVAQYLADTGYNCSPKAGVCKCEGSDAPDQSPKWKLEEHSKSVASRCLRCRKSVALTTVDEDLLGRPPVGFAVHRRSSQVVHVKAPHVSRRCQLGAGN